MNELGTKSVANTFLNTLSWFTFAFCEEGLNQEA